MALGIRHLGFRVSCVKRLYIGLCGRFASAKADVKNTLRVGDASMSYVSPVSVTRLVQVPAWV